LFFGHLTVEKILKAIFTDKKDKTPPFSHNLVYLSEKADLELNDENLELLEEISDFNLEARYPDDKFSFYKKSTVKFTKNKERGCNNFHKKAHRFGPDLFNLPNLIFGIKAEVIASYFNVFVISDRAKMA